MKIKRIFKLVTIAATSTLIFLSIAPSSIATAENKEISITENKNEVQEVQISNQEMFNALEESGYSVEDYLSKEEIEQALLEDQMSNQHLNSDFTTMSTGTGHTGITIVNDTSVNIHLNEYLTRILLAGATGAVGAALMKIPAISAFFSKKSVSVAFLSNSLGAAVGLIPGLVSNGISITLRLQQGRGGRYNLEVFGVYAQQ